MGIITKQCIIFTSLFEPFLVEDPWWGVWVLAVSQFRLKNSNMAWSVESGWKRLLSTWPPPLRVLTMFIILLSSSKVDMGPRRVIDMALRLWTIWVLGWGSNRTAIPRLFAGSFRTHMFIWIWMVLRAPAISLRSSQGKDPLFAGLVSGENLEILKNWEFLNLRLCGSTPSTAHSSSWV